MERLRSSLVTNPSLQGRPRRKCLVELPMVKQIQKHLFPEMTPAWTHQKHR